MQGVVEGYTRHFFNLAHCLVVNDKEQPPRTLQTKMRELEKANAKKSKKRGREDVDTAAVGNAHAANNNNGQVKMAAMAFQGFQNNGNVMQMNTNVMGGGIHDGNAGGGGLLDRLQASQRRLLAAEGGVTGLNIGNTTMNTVNNNNMNMNMHPAPKNTHPMLEIKGRCIPGKVDLPGLVQKVNAAATQLAHRGLLASNNNNNNPSSIPTSFAPPVDPSKYGDPNTTPLILLSPTGDIQFLMTVDGITCAHCVKIVETVLKGAPGRSAGSPIAGLLDVAADRELNVIVIKIANLSEARRIAHESARNLSMVGYTAVARSVNITTLGVVQQQQQQQQQHEEMTLVKMAKVFESLPNVNPTVGNVLDWGLECRCLDNNVLRANCPRHQQMSRHILESFDKAERLLSEIIAGCGNKYGMPCTAGNHCFCKSDNKADSTTTMQQQPEVSQLNDTPDVMTQNLTGLEDTQPIRDGTGHSGRMSMRMSLGGLLGRHSLTSNTTFGRAMSGLSALSIDWENMDDFDINVDHSEGINNDIVNRQQDGGDVGDKLNDGEPSSQQEDSEENFGQIQRVGPRTARRSSLRNHMTNGAVNANMNVSFDM